MTAVGGSLESMSINGRPFAVASDAEANRKLGGFENEVLSNGDGTARLIKTRVPLSLPGITLQIDDSRDDQEFLQEQADANDFFPIEWTYASGETYQASAQLTGEIVANSATATAVVNFMGPGKATRQ